MIPKHIIDLIFETARIEEIIGEYVNLKRAGQNLKGLSPFTDEKTPSFVVSPAKQIFKDFSSGKGGSVVTFLMEHEHFTYPEALKFLAKKYQIEIPPDEEESAEEKQAQNDRESQYIVTQFAQQYFIDTLWETDEGKAVGLSYFKERGFSNKIIKKFKLGYNPEAWDNLAKTASEKGYKTNFLLETGLCKQKDEKIYDTYRGRVMFPIHNLSGRAIGFGGRTLKTDKNIPKYINSPESLIYHKSKTLYGLYFAKSEIIKQNNCYLVEGYTDVISLFEAGIENVVASSGTSLTDEQIRLIKRFTTHVTVLYDGDAAGIKASFRGIDMLLAQGLSVKVVLFPEGEDPDSYSRKLPNNEFFTFLNKNSVDFITFKVGILTKDSQNDPIQRAEMIKEVVQSIAVIPDQISRATYIKACASLFDISEANLYQELNKVRRKNYNLSLKKDDQPTLDENQVESLPINKQNQPISVHVNDDDMSHQERDIIRLLLNYHDISFIAEYEDENGNPFEEKTTVAQFLIDELAADEMTFEDNNLQQVINWFTEKLNQNETVAELDLLNHNNDSIKNLYFQMVEIKYQLHNWEKANIFVKSEKDKIKKAIDSALIALRSKRLAKMIKQTDEAIKEAHQKGNDITTLLSKRKKLDDAKVKLSKPLGIVIR